MNNHKCIEQVGICVLLNYLNARVTTVAQKYDAVVRVQERLIWFHLTSAFPSHWSQIDKTTRKQSCKRRSNASLRTIRV